MNLQPNFDKIKIELYRRLTKSFSVEFSTVLFRAINGEYKNSYRTDLTNMQKELDVLLDRCDIRTAGKLVDLCIEQGGSLPTWIKQKQFVIDYNNHNMLDLIRI